jgi:serpin B
MMQQKSSLQYTSNRHHDAVELPYANSDFSMVVVLPKQRSTNEFMGQTTPEALGELFDSLEMGTVALTMPKFNVRSHVALKDALIRMGMMLPFDENQADFSPITRDVQLFISHVAHEAKITVDEIGTEASAATAVIMVPTSAPLKEKFVSITIDRPFLFFLRDRSTGAILFMGEIGDPS